MMYVHAEINYGTETHVRMQDSQVEISQPGTDGEKVQTVYLGPDEFSDILALARMLQWEGV